MKDVSRRSLLAASIAAPLITPSAKRRRRDLSTLMQAGNDPLVERASAWAVDATNVEAMQHRWQDLESIVFDRAHELNISCSDACDSDWPEAREMRFLSAQMDRGYRRLERNAGRVSRIIAITASGALSKIELGLKWQGPYDWWKPYAWELMEDGIAELRTIIAHS